jgi:hypothetical protein
VPQRLRISICIPAYQAAQFVATAIESAACQTEAAHEIVVSDNWSTDGTAVLLERYKGQVRITRPDHHLCMSDHYWYLTERASGDYVVWLDADNALHPRFIETVAPRLGRYAMIATGRFDCDSHLRPHGYSGLGYLRHTNCGPGELFEYFLQGCRHSHSGTAWTRNWLLSLPRPPKSAEYVTDWYLGIVAAAHCPIAMLPLPRHYYRYHESNASHSEPDRWKGSAGAMLEWLASLDLLDSAQRLAVEQRLRRLTSSDSGNHPRPSLVSRGKQITRDAVSALACHTHRHPAYLR